MSKSAKKSSTDAYKKAGVDIDAGAELVRRIKPLAASTRTPGVLSDIGGFGGLFKPDIENTDSPVLVASTDGVGTKLKLACEWNMHDNIGIDLVAMSANDILVQGAKPLFFLDYFSTSKLDVDVAEKVIAGIANGCKQAGCTLLGGETAEMPDMYAPGEYDLAGFCVGMVGNNDIIDGSSVRVGNSVIGIASSGPHANGYSLIRKLLDASGLGPDSFIPNEERPLREVLLAPTVIYCECIKNILRDIPIVAMSHITGGGFFENIPRCLPSQVRVDIQFNSWEIPPVFHWLAETGKLTWPEMLHTFNCGIGYILVIAKEHVEDVLQRFQGMQISAWEIGSIQRHTKNQNNIEILYE